MRRPLVPAAMIATLTLLCSACGGGGGDDTARTDHASSAGSSPTTTASVSSEALAEATSAATAALLTVDELPSGWSSSTSTDDESAGDEFDAQLSDCLDAPPGLFGGGGDDATDRTHADSPDFNDPDGNVQFSESVAVGRSRTWRRALPSSSRTRRPAA